MCILVLEFCALSWRWHGIGGGCDLSTDKSWIWEETLPCALVLLGTSAFVPVFSLLRSFFNGS